MTDISTSRFTHKLTISSICFEFSLITIIMHETLEISFYCSGGLLEMQMWLNVRGN